MTRLPSLYLLFFFNDTATTEIYTLSLHDALPISQRRRVDGGDPLRQPQGHRLSLSCLHAAQLVDEPAEQHRGAGGPDGARDAVHFHAHDPAPDRSQETSLAGRLTRMNAQVRPKPVERRELCNPLRFLAIDAVEAANSGHPRMPFGMAGIAQVLWRGHPKAKP